MIKSYLLLLAFVFFLQSCGSSRPVTAPSDSTYLRLVARNWNELSDSDKAYVSQIEASYKAEVEEQAKAGEMASFAWFLGVVGFLLLGALTLYLIFRM